MDRGSINTFNTMGCSWMCVLQHTKIYNLNYYYHVGNKEPDTEMYMLHSRRFLLSAWEREKPSRISLSRDQESDDLNSMACRTKRYTVEILDY